MEQSKNMGVLTKVKSTLVDVYQSLPRLHVPHAPEKVGLEHLMTFATMLFVIVAAYNAPKIAQQIIGTLPGRILSLLALLVVSVRDTTLGILAAFTWLALWYIARNYQGSAKQHKDRLVHEQHEQAEARFGSSVLDIQMANQGYTSTPNTSVAMYPMSRPLLASPMGRL